MKLKSMKLKLVKPWLTTVDYRINVSRPCSLIHKRKCGPKVVAVHYPDIIKDQTLHPWGDIEIPNVTFCDYVWDNLEAHGHLPGLVCGLSGRTLLHGQVKEKALGVARSLKSHGIGRGDVVAVILPNCVEYPVLVLACLYLGITITPINPGYTPHEISRQFQASKATFIFCHSLQKDKMLETLSIVGDQVTGAVIIGDKKTGVRPFVAWEDFIGASSGPTPEPPADMDTKNDVAILPFSSGTTGVPKGVALSQHNLIANNVTIACNDPDYMLPASGLHQDVTIAILPMYHIFGLNVTMTASLHFGVKQVILPSFDPQTYVDALEKHKPSFLHLVPPLVGFLANHPLVTSDHLASLRQINVGAAPSGPTLISQFYKKAAPYTIYKEGWGSTEVAGAGTGVCRPYNEGIKRGSVSTILPNLRLQIRDVTSDKPLGPNSVGEIVVKGPHCMMGYSNNQEANKQTFDDQGWMRTGDVGYYEKDGFLYIVDRIKELIKVKGLQVAPAELEDVLRSLPGVGDVAVIGVESEREGEVPRAYIVRTESSLSEQNINDFMKKQVSSHKQLTGGIEFVDSIPKSAAGKILRKDLKALYNNSLNK